MKKQFLISILTGALLVTGAAQAASWQESLSSAASELTKERHFPGRAVSLVPHRPAE